VLGVTLIIGGLVAVGGASGHIMAAVGLIPLVTGVIGWCPIYAIFKTGTKTDEPAQAAAYLRSRSTSHRMDTEANQDEVLFFTAPHCSACKAMRPVATSVASRYDGSVRFTEVDSSADRTSPPSHRVWSVPTFIALHDGEEVGRVVCTHSAGQLEKLFVSAESGSRKRGRISPMERTMRLGVAGMFGVVAVAASTPILWAFALIALLLATWDLIRP
jgi:thiol-disulfide isomerase/thioredoxin